VLPEVEGLEAVRDEVVIQEASRVRRLGKPGAPRVQLISGLREICSLSGVLKLPSLREASSVCAGLRWAIGGIRLEAVAVCAD
jgi:hypothetical protein